jgi:hypothetical protein
MNNSNIANWHKFKKLKIIDRIKVIYGIPHISQNITINYRTKACYAILKLYHC